MTRQRAGYRNVFTQLTEAAWAALVADAEKRGVSVTTRLNELLAKHYRIPAEQIPPPRRTGRKPKR